MSALKSLDGRVAVVTGAASGIGRGIAEALIAAGATVVVADIDEAAATEAAAAIGGHARRVDVTDFGSVEALAAGALADFGRVDIIVNNAGVGPLAPFEDLTLADFRWVLDINLWGVIHGLKAFLPLLTSNPEGGHIVNTASVAAVLPSVGVSAYAASKAALTAISESLALELEPEGKVGISVVFPAVVRTNIEANARNRPGFDPDGPQAEDFLPPTRVLEPRDVGELVVAGIRSGQRYIFTHPEVRDAIAAHQAEILSSIASTSP